MSLEYVKHLVTWYLVCLRSADERFDASFHTNVLVNSSGYCQYLPPGIVALYFFFIKLVLCICLICEYFILWVCPASCFQKETGICKGFYLSYLMYFQYMYLIQICRHKFEQYILYS